MSELEIVIEEIDRVLGNGYAIRNPVVIAAVTLARSFEVFALPRLGEDLITAAEGIHAAIRELAGTVYALKGDYTDG